MIKLKNTVISAACFTLLFLIGIASAETKEQKCTTDFYDTIGRHLKSVNLTPRSQGGNVISEACKTWPFNNSLVLSAFAYDEGVEYEKKAIAAVIDKKTMRVLTSHQWKISEDAITEVGEYSLQLDTARYQLAKDVRAFGLRFNSSAIGASCGEARWNDELTLLVPEGKRLRPVLSLNMYKQKSLKGCLSVFSPDAIWEDAVLTIETGKTITNGFHDLVVTAKITVSSNGASIENIKDRMERHTLRYNGKYYEKGKSIPWWLEI